MAETTVALQITTAPVVSIFRLVDRLAQAQPDAPALVGMSFADLRTASLDLRDAGDLTVVGSRVAEVAIPAAIGNLTNGAVAFRELPAPVARAPGELLLSDPMAGGAADWLRLPQDRMVRTASALAARFGFGPADRLFVDGPFDDPGTWLAVISAFCAGASIVPSPRNATVVWSLTGDIPDLSGSARIVHVRAGANAMADLQRAHPGVTFVNGLTLAAGGGLPVCSDPRDPPDTVASTLGRPLGDTEAMIVDPETGMDRLLYETGEIWLRRGGTAIGYTSGRTPLAQAGFLPTGLCGYLDSEGRLVLGEAPTGAA